MKNKKRTKKRGKKLRERKRKRVWILRKESGLPDKTIWFGLFKAATSTTLFSFFEMKENEREKERKKRKKRKKRGWNERKHEC